MGRVRSRIVGYKRKHARDWPSWFPMTEHSGGFTHCVQDGVEPRTYPSPLPLYFLIYVPMTALCGAHKLSERANGAIIFHCGKLGRDVDCMHKKLISLRDLVN
jgi:hypothetical protein